MELANRGIGPIDLSGVLVQPPPTPSKWDIIPIHASDRATFKFCRRQWGWSSPSQLNLVPKASIYGVRMPLWFGTGIHYALERYYNPTLREDPVVTFEAWFDLQWKGGLVSEVDIKDFGLWDRAPERTDYGYLVSGLSDILPNPAFETFDEHRDIGVGMLTFYKQYAEAHDNFSVISVEHDFSVPILDQFGAPIYMLDSRRMPKEWEPDTSLENEYGPLMKCRDDGRLVLKQVHARGRMDKVVQDNESGRFGIHDYKTSGRALDDKYFRGLELNDQFTTYMWAAQREAAMHNLEYKKIDYVIVEALLKAYPRPPSPLQNGNPSISRSDESTTAEMFEQYIQENGLAPEYKVNVKWQQYYTWLLETGDLRFINRKVVRRNEHQKNSCGVRIFQESMDMLSPNIPLYPNPSTNFGCLNCVFRQPCIMMEDGSDYQNVIDDAYESNYDR